MKYHNARNTARGFGLTELLVAIAIFLTIIGAIGLVFNGSLRSLRQAEQSQQIYEMVRGAMQVMERDLTNAFVAREYGDIYQFYGTPIGFTFVGLVKYNPDDQPNIARVTYVIRRDTGKLADRSEFADFVNADDLPFFENDGIDNDFDGVVDEAGELPTGVPTFSLIRYVERNRDNLESFPIDWDAPIVDDNSPGLPDVLGDVIGNPENPDTSYDNFVGYAIENGLCRADDVRCLEEAAKSARRQVWIASLAGLGSEWYTSGSGLPDFFDLNPDLDPDDYVLLDNIAVDDVPTAFQNIELYVADVTDPDAVPTAATRIRTAALQEHIDELQSVTYNGQFFEYTEWVRGTVEIDPGPPVETASVTRPNNMGFWLDWRNINLSNNGVDDTGDGFADNVGDLCDGGATFDLADFCNGVINCPNVELPVDCTPHGGGIIYAPGAGPGSPLSPSIPQQVNFRFRLFVEAPTVGAPDFERNFNFQLDIPSASARVSTTE